MPQKWQPWQPQPQQGPPSPVEVAPEAARSQEEEGEQDVMSTQQLQGLLGKHGYRFHLVEPFSGSGESEDEGELVVCVFGACLQREQICMTG